MAFHSLNTENKRFQCEDYFDYCEGPFTISIQALFNTLPLESFSFERALAYIAWCLAFVACVLMVASIFLKLWTCTLFRRNTSVYTLYKHLCFRPQLTNYIYCMMVREIWRFISPRQIIFFRGNKSSYSLVINTISEQHTTLQNCDCLISPATV